jgi:hypothetical protein
MSGIPKAVLVFFVLHVVVSSALVVLHSTIPKLVQYAVMPGIVLLRPLARLAGRVGLESSLPLAMACGLFCILLGSGLWAVLFSYVLRVRRF